MFGEFDEAAYLRANPDVKGMIDRGLIRSGFEHWHAVGANEHALGDRPSGFFEHDLVYDEAAYLRQNPDVADAVRARAARSGYQHWIRFGRQEVARGIRWGPFAARNGFLRPFVVARGDGVFLLVASVPEAFEPDEEIQIRAGAAAPVSVGRDAISVSGPVRIVDVCGGVMTVRLVVCAPPADLDLGRVAGRVTLSIGRVGADPLVFVFRDRGIQAFFFERADDANEFLGMAKARRPHGMGLDASVELALAHLPESPRAKGYEKPLRLRIEEVELVSENAVRVAGWVAFPPAKLETCRAWYPEACEFIDLAKSWSRVSRSDVLLRFREELAGTGHDLFGFVTTLEFAESASFGRRRRLFFGVKEAGHPEHWLEIEFQGAELVQPL